MPPVPEQQESVATVSWPGTKIWRADILFVIDDSPAMQPYASGLADAIRTNAYALFSLDNFIDVHLGVVTADVGDESDRPHTPVPGSCGGWGDAGVFRRSALVEGTYVHYRRDADGEHSNVSGTIPDALATLADVGANGCVRARPLEAMRIALDHDPHDGGFRRANTPLAVMIVAAQDDDSPRSVDAYATFLRQQHPNAGVAIAGGRPLTALCGEPATDRLYEMSQLFGPHGYLQSICTLGNGDLLGSALLDVFPGWGVPMAMPCFDEPLADLDPAMPGVQPDCSVTEYINRGRTNEQQWILPACGTGALPCWHLVEDSQCSLAQHLRLDVDRGGADAPDNDVVEAQCVSS